MNDRHVWASRLVCERKSHSEAQFITLTYRDESLPTSEAEAKKSFQNFIKRYRKNTGHQPRYFACMEYGSRYGRIHWHAIFFGASTHYEIRYKNRHRIKVVPEIEDNWQNGSTYVKACNYATEGANIMQYVVGYILKDAWKAQEFWTGKTKSEVGLMSRRPYIGKPVVPLICELLTTKPGAERCMVLGTVPNRLKMAGKHFNLFTRIRKEVCRELNYPYLEIPRYSGCIIDVEGRKIINETPIIHKPYRAAAAAEKAVSRSISRLRMANPTPATG